MKVIYIYRKTHDNYELDESMCFHCLYLSSERTAYFCSLSALIIFWNSRREWNDQELVELYFDFLPENQQRVTREEVTTILSYAKEAKKIKHKLKPDLEKIIDERRLKDFIKAEVFDFLEEVLDRFFITERLELYNQDNSEIICIPPEEDETAGTYDMLLPIITDGIFDNKAFLMFNRFSKEILDEYAIKIDSDTAEISWDRRGFFYFPLFTMPFCDITNYQRKEFRKKMLNEMTSLSEMLWDYKSSMKDQIFNNVLMRNTQEFCLKIKPEADKVQKLIDNYEYFLQFMNSRANHVKFRLFAGICSLDMFVTLQEKANLIKSGSANKLRHNLKNLMDIDRCEIFLFYEIRDQDNKPADF